MASFDTNSRPQATMKDKNAIYNKVSMCSPRKLGPNLKKLIQHI